MADELISLGYKGESGGRTKSPSNNIKVGVIEPGPLNTEHVGWLDWRGGPSRVKAAYHCDDTSCDITDMSTVVEDKSHGTAVTWAIAGSIEQGQDPAYSSSTSRQNRSGMLSEAEIYFYWANTFYGHNIITAFEQAIIDGVDIINMSFNTKGGQCSMTADSSSMNAAIADILDTGILPIGCAGNTESIHGECTLWYPALRSEIVAVSPLESFTGTPYENIEWSPWASVGGMPTQTLAGWTATTAGIDIAAPGHYRLHFTDGTDTYSFTEIWGCSMATPIVSGAAGMLREVMNDLGWDGNDAKALMVNLMLLGDASDGTAGGHSYTRVSTKTGYGRLHMHYPSDDNLESPWDWSWRSFVMNEGDRISWPVGDGTPLSHEITDWKWAFLWFESALDSTSDIVIAVWDTCPPGGGEEIVAIDPSFSLRKRIRLDDSDTEGRCLEMRAYAYLAPPEGTRVWSADYFHSGDPQLH
ncbi:MAG: S8/S53 family peptidase [Deltaproteobacteria bacterium]|nr:S8/S53 family peptidase [Deltaproteobacteria bacterium]